MNLDNFVCRASSDSVKTDLELTCRKCEEHICDVEDGDSIQVLMDVIENHQCTTEENE